MFSFLDLIVWQEKRIRRWRRILGHHQRDRKENRNNLLRGDSQAREGGHNWFRNHQSDNLLLVCVTLIYQKFKHFPLERLRALQPLTCRMTSLACWTPTGLGLSKLRKLSMRYPRDRISLPRRIVRKSFVPLWLTCFQVLVFKHWLVCRLQFYHHWPRWKNIRTNPFPLIYLNLTDQRSSQEVHGFLDHENRKVEKPDSGPWTKVWWSSCHNVPFPVICAPFAF